MVVSKRHYLLYFLLKCLKLYLHNKILIHLELVFMYGVRYSNYIFFYMDNQLSLYCFWSFHPVCTDWQCHLYHIWSVYVCMCLLFGKIFSIGLLVIVTMITQSSYSGLARKCWNLVGQVQYHDLFRTVRDP